MTGKLRNMTAVYLLKGDHILLLFRQGSRVSNDVWIGSAGGHFESFELNDAKACAVRELKEELGLNESDVQNLALRYITLRKTKGEIRQNYYFFATVKEAACQELQSNEGILKWVSLKELNTLIMPFTAKYVMEHYCREGRFSEKLYTGVANANGVDFLELTDT